MNIARTRDLLLSEYPEGYGHCKLVLTSGQGHWETKLWGDRRGKTVGCWLVGGFYSSGFARNISGIDISQHTFLDSSSPIVPSLSSLLHEQLTPPLSSPGRGEEESGRVELSLSLPPFSLPPFSLPSLFHFLVSSPHLYPPSLTCSCCRNLAATLSISSIMCSDSSLYYCYLGPWA